MTGAIGNPCGSGTDLNRGSGGFTLVEVMIVIAIIGTLASIAIPQYSAYIEKANYAKAFAEIRILEKEIQGYLGANETLPHSLADIGRGDLLDPWGNPYQYVNMEDTEEKGKGKAKSRKDHFQHPLNTDFDLYSMGPDGQSNEPLTAAASRDDIIRANDGGFLGKGEDY